MSDTPDASTPVPPKSPLGATSAGETAGQSKPAFKVTRSPFAPRIGGVGTVTSGPMSIGASAALGGAGAAPKAGAAGAAPNRPPAPGARPVARRRQSADTTPALLVVDLIAAAVTIAAAVMMAHGLGYF